MFRAGLHLGAGAYASYGLNPTRQSPIGSEYSNTNTNELAT